MSRYSTEGLHPKTKQPVFIEYGWDKDCGFGAGYFFQVENPELTDDNEDEVDEFIVNEGFFKPISKERLLTLAVEWYVKDFKLPEAVMH